MSDIAIRVDNVSKRYRLGEGQAFDNVREAVAHAAKAPLRWLAGAKNGNGGPAVVEQDETLWALRDVNFEVKRGEVLGIIGRNGAGKSTLLKILSRITEPSDGTIDVFGRVASLLEVGTGFHQDLTGRENIYLNGSILGMTKKEIDRKFDEIVAFAGVERFIDTPVKRYSSGMGVRLGFAVAAHLEPEILIVDEVLAVGDQEFQRKCLGKMNDVAQSGRTVLFVSHNMAAVSSLCSRGILLESGSLKLDGEVDQAVGQYCEAGASANDGFVWERSEILPISSVGYRSASLTLHGQQPHLRLELELELESRTGHEPAFIACDIHDSLGAGIMQVLPTLDRFVRSAHRCHSAQVSVDLPPLIPGRYTVSLWVGSHNTHTYDAIEHCLSFEILESPTVGRSFPHSRDHGYVVPVSSIRYRASEFANGASAIINT